MRTAVFTHINHRGWGDVDDFLLPANSLTGLYVTFADGSDSLGYTNGSNTFANADLQLDLGVGKASNFSSTFSPRTWNGTINYQTQAVPEPASVLGLLAFGVLGAGSTLKRKQQQKQQTANLN